jgi:hypothetical protein
MAARARTTNRLQIGRAARGCRSSEPSPQFADRCRRTARSRSRPGCPSKRQRRGLRTAARSSLPRSGWSIFLMRPGARHESALSPTSPICYQKGLSCSEFPCIVWTVIHKRHLCWVPHFSLLCEKLSPSLRRLVVRHAADQPLPASDFRGVGESGPLHHRDDVCGRILLELTVRV